MSGMNTGGMGMENVWTEGTVPDLVSGVASAETRGPLFEVLGQLSGEVSKVGTEMKDV